MLLERINHPRDVASLDPQLLPQLAAELREEIVKVCSLNGGHLAASLGAVEIAVAIHHVFDAEKSCAIWDTGHQAYAHKLLTGRRESFPSLRRFGGLSGFLKRSESPHDHFGAGHACTALSAAMGFSRAAAFKGSDEKAIAILGDGAATGGMVYEGINNALNHAGNLLVILNDNDMSISPNVGAISRVLTRLTSTRAFLRIEGGAWRILGRIPRIGNKLRVLASRAKFGLKHMILPSNFFEDFGFRYFGPIDGHDLPLLVSTLQQLKEIEGPVILHVLTRKGKGCSFAEKNPAKYHGFAPFYRETGVKRSESDGCVSYTEVFSESMMALAEADPALVAITAAMPEGTGLKEFAAQYPNRFFDVGIAEPHAVTFAAGLAARGLKPVVAIYSTFLQRAFDMIFHDVALQNLPVIFAIDRAGLVGEDGPTHHGVLDLGYLRMIPGMVVMAPSDDQELRRMMTAAIGYEKGPTAIRYPRASVRPAEDALPVEPVAIGRARILRRGRQVQVWAIGSMVTPSLAAAERLAPEGLDISVVDARFAAPLDAELLKTLSADHSLLVTVEEGNPVGGFGEGLINLHRNMELPEGKVLQISLPDGFSPQGERNELLAALEMDSDSIADRILRAWQGARSLSKDGVERG